MTTLLTPEELELQEQLRAEVELIRLPEPDEWLAQAVECHVPLVWVI